jgi:hypothetical protein
VQGGYSGELVWYRQDGTIQFGVQAPPNVRRALGAGKKPVYAASTRVHWISKVPDGRVVFRHPIQLVAEPNRILAGPIYAVLAGGSGAKFNGLRMDFRDLMQTARSKAEFLYVLPAGHVRGDDAYWSGFVRLGTNRWISLPCPLPQAVYNRVPTRKLECSPEVAFAKRRISELGIPLFNPDYFNKAVIYKAIVSARLSHYLPDSTTEFREPFLRSMLEKHGMVYLKPAGGSIGHGIMRVHQHGKQFVLEVLKNGVCKSYDLFGKRHIWREVQRHRLRGPYVMQAGKRLIEWRGRPCDFRVLVQKYRQRWHIVGKGVRVAGPNSITTHVPHGGSVMDAESVLHANFGDAADEVNERLDEMILACANAIDAYYGKRLGEMSMDIGIDSSGGLWFFEANAKPMKFDEKDIRTKSLRGVLNYLRELSGWKSGEDA